MAVGRKPSTAREQWNWMSRGPVSKHRMKDSGYPCFVCGKPNSMYMLSGYGACEDHKPELVRRAHFLAEGGTIRANTSL